MLNIILPVALLIIVLAVPPLLDRFTQAPIMRRHVNDGTNTWRLRKRASEREDSGLSGLMPEDALESEWVRAPKPPQ